MARKTTTSEPAAAASATALAGQAPAALRSMTGFARSDGSRGTLRWHWEVRSVNGRGLDIRVRVPAGFDAIEAPARELVGRKVTRGSVAISLNLQRSDGATELRLNKAALAQVIAAAAEVGRSITATPPTIDGLLAIRGVLEPVEPVESEAEAEARNQAMLASLAGTLDAMVKARESEGQRLARIIADQLAGIDRLLSAVEQSPVRTPAALAARLREQIARLVDNGVNLDEARLYQEAVLLSTRFDVEEELQRLKAHIAGARELLAAPEAVGRRFDFLTQEFNREANTLCSKSNDADITRIGLELKAVIDQMREQVQNIE